MTRSSAAALARCVRRRATPPTPTPATILGTSLTVDAHPGALCAMGNNIGGFRGEGKRCCHGGRASTSEPGKVSPGGFVGTRCRGGGRGLSTFLADSLRESVTSAGIDRICNGAGPGSTIDDPTVSAMDDFVYNIDLQQMPANHYKPSPSTPDPFELVKGELSTLSDGIKALVGTDHPVLNAAAKYFFEIDGGKKIRPTMVLLMSHACNSHGRQEASTTGNKETLEAKNRYKDLMKCQRRLAEITEMIHTASLFHDDVIDEANTRRGVPSVNKVFGNKLAILAGDFLLARASVNLARLRSTETVELLSTVIEHLVKGEVLQMRPLVEGGRAFEYYVRKNYYKTGSLMANSCKAAAILGEHGHEIQTIAHEYGKRVGLAFQLVDDILDFEGDLFTLGKPALNDLRQGLATAPVLLAAQEQPRLNDLIQRKFEAPGDVDEALALVQASDGIKRAKDVARVQAEAAMEAILHLSYSPEREALVQLAHKVVHRTH
ncbi:unnamed protein product [Discosporangium mesarthrocarpum]